MLRLAWARGRLATGGTTVLPGPEETVRVTVEPSSALTPGWGDWLITVPEGWALATLIVLGVKLAFSRMRLALATVCLTTLGTRV